jgi:hypothetical protein
MSTLYDLPDNMVWEANEYQTLKMKGSTRTTTGTLSLTSTSSGNVYTSTTGELGMMQILAATPLAPYLMTASIINNKTEQTNFNSHLADNVAHITSSERTTWNNKMDKSGGTYTGAVAHGRNEVSQPKLKDYSEVVSSNATATGNVTLDLSVGNVFNLTLTGNVTLTFSNSAPSGQACSFTLIINQGATAYSITWPVSVKWPGDNVPDLSDVNKTAILTFITINNGTRWYGFLAGSRLVT